jgi:hypothetical protein
MNLEQLGLERSEELDDGSSSEHAELLNVLSCDGMRVNYIKPAQISERAAGGKYADAPLVACCLRKPLAHLPCRMLLPLRLCISRRQDIELDPGQPKRRGKRQR